MSIVYIEKEYLDVILESDIRDYDFSSFFSSFKYSYIYVVNDEQILLGYIDRQSFLTGEERLLKRFHFTLGKNSVSAETLFGWHADLKSIPVVDLESKFLGAYIRSFPDELVSLERVMNRIALSVLPAFVEEFIAFFRSKGIRSLLLLSEKDDFERIREIVGGSLQITLIDDISNNLCQDSSLIVDMKYSKSFRELRFGCNGVDVFSLEELVALSILPTTMEFLEGLEVPMIFVEGPLKEKLSRANERWPHLFMRGSLSRSLDNDNLISSFFQGDQELINWAKDYESGIMGGDCVCTNGIHLMMSECLGSIDATKDGELPRIFLFGSCFAYGVCVPPRDRISTCMQGLFAGEYEVVNLAVKNGRSLLNDLLYILNTRIKRGDIIIDLNYYRSEISKEIQAFQPIYECSTYLNDHPNPSYFFLDNTFHSNAAVCQSIATFLFQIVVERKSVNLVSKDGGTVFLHKFDRLGRIDSASVLGQSLMQTYISYVKRHKRSYHDGAIIGSVILTANPLTRGHEYLVHYAKQRCEVLYVFIVEEDRFEYSTLDRLSFAFNVFDDPGIVILSTGNVMTAYYTFPEYFSVSHSRAIGEKMAWHPDYHCFLFGAVVAPILGINRRFIGEEVPGSITDHYNEKVREILPSYGIVVEVVPRLNNRDGIPVSASRARLYANSEQWGKLAEVVSPRVMNSMVNHPPRESNLKRAGKWSSTYKEGEFLIKKYNYANLPAIKREVKATAAARDYGLNTPSFKGTVERKGFICNSFEYVQMRPVDEVSVLQSRLIRQQCETLLAALPKVSWDLMDHYWQDFLLPEFDNALSFLSIDTSHYTLYLSKLIPTVFIHGDLTCQNLGLTKGEELVIFDFQHGSLGPAGWDKAFFAATFPSDKFFLSMSREERYMAEAISAIRLGRSIRKQAPDLAIREKLFQSWVKGNHKLES